jgi:hypothetical protein
VGLAAVALATVLGACTRPDRGTPVSGRVTQSPGCGVVYPYQPVCPNPPVAGEVQIRSVDGTVIARARTDADGRYHLAAPAGTYTLAVVPDVPAEGEGKPPTCYDTPLVVTARPARVDVICGSGVR